MDLQCVVNAGGEGEVGIFGMSTTPLTHGVADFPIALSRADFSSMDQWVDCGGGSPYDALNYDGTGAPSLALTLMSFEVTRSTTAADCGDSRTQTCKRSFGKLWYRLTMAFDDSDDPAFAASASFDGVINGARWETAVP